jgi:hypothetical protein
MDDRRMLLLSILYQLVRGLLGLTVVLARRDLWCGLAGFGVRAGENVAAVDRRGWRVDRGGAVAAVWTDSVTRR